MDLCDLFESYGFICFYSFLWIFQILILDPMDLNQILDQGLFGPPRQQKTVDTPKKSENTRKFSCTVRKFVSNFSFALQLKAKDLPKLSPIRPFVVRNPQKFCALSTLFSLLKTIFGADRASLFFGLQKLGRYSLCLYQVGMDPKKIGKNLHRILQLSEVWRPNSPNPLTIRAPWRVWDAMQAPADLLQMLTGCQGIFRNRWVRVTPPKMMTWKMCFPFLMGDFQVPC